MMQSKASTKYHVIWKRPDGFHGASPVDFKVVSIGNQAKLWLHLRDQTNFPFRISGGWQEEKASARLNRLINLLDQPDVIWNAAVVKIFDDSMGDSPVTHLDHLIAWVADLKLHLKGDTWEVEIMDRTLEAVVQQLQKVKTNLPAGSADLTSP
jgi:hypothetical protein